MTAEDVIDLLRDRYPKQSHAELLAADAERIAERLRNDVGELKKDPRLTGGK